MKALFVCICMGCVITVSAQVKKYSTTKQTGKSVVLNSSGSGIVKNKKTTPVNVLSSTNSYSAKTNAPELVKNNFSISDPTIVALNARANGADIQISNSGIVGMPKRAYGFGNGKLSFSSTAATSSGTITGSGTVGTGSSLGSIGSYGPGTALNGKSPEAGSAMWGNAMGLIVKDKKKE